MPGGELGNSVDHRRDRSVLSEVRDLPPVDIEHARGGVPGALAGPRVRVALREGGGDKETADIVEPNATISARLERGTRPPIAYSTGGSGSQISSGLQTLKGSGGVRARRHLRDERREALGEPVGERLAEALRGRAPGILYGRGRASPRAAPRRTRGTRGRPRRLRGSRPLARCLLLRALEHHLAARDARQVARLRAQFERLATAGVDRRAPGGDQARVGLRRAHDGSPHPLGLLSFRRAVLESRKLRRLCNGTLYDCRSASTTCRDSSETSWQSPASQAVAPLSLLVSTRWTDFACRARTGSPAGSRRTVPSGMRTPRSSVRLPLKVASAKR
jgi:hypothetical protein